VRPEAVRLLTAFRAKGHQWRRVFVAGVQEGVWPDFRSPDLLLATDCLPDGPFEMDRSATIAAGRRLFYLAVSRSSGDVIVTAVRGTDGEADQPSRFIGELQVPPEEPSRFPRPALSLTELVVTLRDAITDPLASPELRRAAARRLARLSELGEPAADPRSWWGTAPVSSSGAPARVPRQDDDGPIRLSGSQLESLLGCPRQHFLSRQAKADPPRNSAATLGSVIHSLASHAISDDLDQDELTEHLDSVWDRIPFDAAWLSMSEREEADAALRRLLVWSQANGYREVAGVEVPFTARLEVAGAEVLLTGQVDRLEHDGEGGLRIVDFKTGRSLPTRAAVARQDQLGVYQLAVQLGAFEQVAPGVRRAGGGELVYLRHSDRNPDYPRTFDQPSLSDEPHPALSGPRAAPTWVHERLTEAVRIVRDGSYPATPGEDVCRWCPFTASCPARGGEQVVR
jgi:RecB family exonuclease